MGYKMDHKWQKGMYSGMAADKLEFIQKTGNGKSMAKQTEKKKEDDPKENDPNAPSGLYKNGKSLTNRQAKEHEDSPNEIGPLGEEIPKDDLDLEQY